MKLKAVLFSLFFCSLSFGQNIAVYTKDDALNSSNISIPRIKIKNSGNQDINGFTFYYYITVPPAKTPVLENWWTPNVNVSLEKITNTVYRVKFDGTNTILPVSEVLPNNDGYCIGLHYTNWTGMYKGDNPSFISSDTFALNNNIPVYNNSGNLIAGNVPVFPPPVGELGLEVYVRDESYGSQNQSTPRIYLINTGTQTISDFAIVYYFTVENGKEPVLSEYYLPNCTNVEYVRVRNNVYKAILIFEDMSIEPGETFPNNSGLSFGLNYSDYSNWDITNDFSNPQSGSFVKSDRITILNSEGKPIYGISPENNPRLFPLSALLRNIPHEVLSYTEGDYRGRMNPFPNDSARVPMEIFGHIIESVLSNYPSFDFDTLSENTNALQSIFDDFPNLTQEEVIANLPDIIMYYAACQFYEIANEVKYYFDSASNSLGKIQNVTALSNPIYNHFDINEEELAYMRNNLLCVQCVYLARERAIYYTNEVHYPDMPKVGTEADAFRHLLFSSLLVEKCKDVITFWGNLNSVVKFAKGLLDAHESGDKRPSHPLEVAQDYHNNDVGLNYIKNDGARTRQVKWFWFGVWVYKPIPVIDAPSEEAIVNDVKRIAQAGKTFDNEDNLPCLKEYAVWIDNFQGCPDNTPLTGNVSYRVYVSKRGWFGSTWAIFFSDKKWLGWVSDGSTTGKDDSYQVEAAQIKIVNGPAGMGVEYRAHVQGNGWGNWVQDGQTAGTTGDWKRMEAIEIKLANAPLGYNITYRVRVQNKGWMSWVSNGGMAGTTGEGRRIEKIEIKLTKQ